MQSLSSDFRHLLTARKRELLEMGSMDRERVGPVELDQTRVGRLSRMDALQGQAMSSAVKRRREAELQRIEAALARLEEGEFGYCMTCGDEIAAKRLEIDPAVTQCTRCAASGPAGLI